MGDGPVRALGFARDVGDGAGVRASGTFGLVRVLGDAGAAREPGSGDVRVAGLPDGTARDGLVDGAEVRSDGVADGAEVRPEGVARLPCVGEGVARLPVDGRPSGVARVEGVARAEGVAPARVLRSGEGAKPARVGVDPARDGAAPALDGVAPALVDGVAPAREGTAPACATEPVDLAAAPRAGAGAGAELSTDRRTAVRLAGARPGSSLNRGVG